MRGATRSGGVRRSRKPGLRGGPAFAPAARTDAPWSLPTRDTHRRVSLDAVGPGVPNPTLGWMSRPAVPENTLNESQLSEGPEWKTTRLVS